jgi:hypothetical protein
MSIKNADTKAAQEKASHPMGRVTDKLRLRRGG